MLRLHRSRTLTKTVLSSVVFDACLFRTFFHNELPDDTFCHVLRVFDDFVHI